MNEMNDWTPEPQPFGWLEPPRKYPPTAVGVATPPPPRRPHRRSTRSRWHFRKIAAVAALGVATSSAGIAAGIALPLNALYEVGAGLTALEVATWFVRVRRRRLRSFAFRLGWRWT
jgi:hypothetical protein